MALMYFCEDDHGNCLHVHEQTDPSDRTPAEVSQSCIGQHGVTKARVILHADVQAELDALVTSGVWDQATKEHVHRNYLSRDPDPPSTEPPAINSGGVNG